MSVIVQSSHSAKYLHQLVGLLLLLEDRGCDIILLQNG
jgi:hypothetical protein